MNGITEEMQAQQPPKGTGNQNVADVIIKQLQLWGVKRIYGVIGDAIFGLMDGLSRQNDLEWIGVKHESVAAMMASAEAKLTGRIAVCAAQMGPGLTNLMTGLGDAYLDGAPVLAISGQAPVSKIGTNYKQYIDQQVLVQAITSFSRIVVHPDAVVDALTRGHVYRPWKSYTRSSVHTFRSMDTSLPDRTAQTDSKDKSSAGREHDPYKR